MIRPLVTLLSALGLALALRAQVNVTLSTAQEQFLLGEELEVAVKISNFSGRKLTLGADAGWLAFHVAPKDSGLVKPTGDLEESGEFGLENATSGTLRYNLQNAFELDRPAQYRVTATVQIPGGEAVTSAPLRFEIIRGARLWDRLVGVSGTDTNAAPETRKFIVQQANYLRSVKLFVRVTDASETATYRVIRIGPTVSFAKPQYLVDRQNRLHVLHQYDADEYLYHAINTAGDVEQRHNYVIADRRPELRVNDRGEVAVIGGVRRLTSADLPAPREVGATVKPSDEASGK
jgi:hypothetical protein